MALAYAGATGVTALALGLRWLLRDSMAGYPFLLFIPAIVASAFLFGQGTGFYAAVLSEALAAYFFLEPVGRLRIGPGDAEPLLTFTVIGIGIAGLTEVLRQALTQVAAAKEQKDLLFAELTHRIKNDFATIGAVISLQARNQPEPVRAALDQAVDRIRVLAKIHEQLQHGEGHAGVNARDYLEGLCGSVSNVVAGCRGVAVKVRADPVLLDPRSSSAVGLIVNELVTNALKYAFPGDREGAIEVGFTMETDGTAEIVVSDDGVGCPKTAREGTGSLLVRLMARQMNGDVDRNEDGTGCRTRVTLALTPVANEEGTTALPSARSLFAVGGR